MNDKASFTVQLPVFPEREVRISDYGAVMKLSDLKSLRQNQKAINTAIKEIANMGGGTVVVENGLWHTGPIQLKSNVRLFLEPHAIVKFDKAQELYPLVLTDYEGTTRIRAISPISAEYAENIAIEGKGMMDGAGDSWRPVKEWKLTKRQWNELLRKSSCIIETGEGGFWFPTKSSYGGFMNQIEETTEEGLGKAADFYDYYRPVLVSLKHCHKVLLDGVTFSNSPAWNVHPYFCSHLTVRNVHIRNSYAAQNGDGIDIESCVNVHMHDAVLETGDDAICIKAGKDREGRKIKGACENVYIHDCRVYQAHGGFVIGSEMSRDVRNVFVEHCDFIGTDIGVRIKSAMGRGGVVENIHIHDINMTDIINEAVLLTMSYHPHRIGEKEDTVEWSKEDIPHFRNIELSDIHVNGASRALVLEPIQEFPDTITNIRMKHSFFYVEKTQNLSDYGRENKCYEFTRSGSVIRN